MVKSTYKTKRIIKLIQSVKTNLKAKITHTSTVGLPLESKIERATIFVIGMLFSLQEKLLKFEVCKYLNTIIY